MSKNFFPVRREYLKYPVMYGDYACIKYGQQMVVRTDEINSMQAWQYHYDCVINIFKDGIESDIVHKTMIDVEFPNDYKVQLSLFDWYFNLVMWRALVGVGGRIMAYHVFFPKYISQRSIKDFVDEFIIDDYRKKISNKKLNNVCDDFSNCFHDIEKFAGYLANTINLEDSAFLMNVCKEYYDCLHADTSMFPLAEIKDEGMKIAKRARDLEIESIKYLGYDHCTANAWKVEQGINIKQHKDTAINIGTKPDGKGSIYPTSINHSFMNGGVTTPQDYRIESSTGRTAQIIKFENVGGSGGFARILGLNNMGEFLNLNPTYDCGTKNYLKLFVSDGRFLERINNRYYRLSPNGIERIINFKEDRDLIGKTVYLRSPCKCASHARGNGICFKCFGDLAYSLFDSESMSSIDPGRMASELMSSALTQKLISAKHMLESAVKKLIWCETFSNFFEIEGNLIKIGSDLNLKRYAILIDPDSIELENDEDDDISESDIVYNEYITRFYVLDKTSGEQYEISNAADEQLYLTNSINLIIRRKGEPVDGMIRINFTDIGEDTLFVVPIRNNELSETLKYFENLLNKKDVVKGLDIDTCAQKVIETAIKGGLNISAVYIEIIISNQIRDAENILDTAKWWLTDPPYRLITLDAALINNPSVTKSLSYKKVETMLYNPLTFRKNKASFMDLFFMKKPQVAIKNSIDSEEENKSDKVNKNELIDPMMFSDGHADYTVPAE